MQASQLARTLAAMAVIVVACPAALFGGAILGCVNSTDFSSCALNGIVISPFLLAAAGLVAGFLLRGGQGIALLAVAVVIGMAIVPLVAGLAGKPVPIDPFAAVIATIWFGFPIFMGYLFGRGLSRLFATRS